MGAKTRGIPSLTLMLLDNVGQVLGKNKMLWSTRGRGIERLQLGRYSRQRGQREQSSRGGKVAVCLRELDSQFAWRATFGDRQRGRGKAQKVTPNPQAKKSVVSDFLI